MPVCRHSSKFLHNVVVSLCTPASGSGGRAASGSGGGAQISSHPPSMPMFTLRASEFSLSLEYELVFFMDLLMPPVHIR